MSTSDSGPSPTAVDPIADEVRRFYDERHEDIEAARRARAYYYSYLTRVLQNRIHPGQRVLDIGCGSGHLLATLRPSRGVGIDLSPRAVADARARYGRPDLTFMEGDGTDPSVLEAAGGPFDAVVIVNAVTHFADVQRAFESLRPLVHARTRLFLYSYSRAWQPVFRLAERLGLKHRPPPESWLPPEEVRTMLYLADFEVVRRDAHVIFPAEIPLVSDFVNRFLGHLPGAEALSLMYGLIARPRPGMRTKDPRASVSVVIPCRNEAGHIRPLVDRLPALPAGSEFLFIEGHSRDDTAAVIQQVIAERPGVGLRFLQQKGEGKGDAVRLGFQEARGDIVLILDSDMGVAPADIPRFVEALESGKAEMVNGSRLVYPMEQEAMRFLNLLANKAFAWIFSWILGQQVRDTLCGTKALWREDYERIAAERSFFGDFDPFGDFDLLFGAARLNLKLVDVAVRYHQRSYGTTNISRFRHGWLLLQMSAFAARKLKFL